VIRASYTLGGTGASIVEVSNQEKFSNIAFVQRQKEGFEDDAKQKILKHILDSWSVAFSVAPGENGIPDTIKTPTIDHLMRSMLGALDTVEPNQCILPSSCYNSDADLTADDSVVGTGN
jgi:hypothetical protein